MIKSESIIFNRNEDIRKQLRQKFDYVLRWAVIKVIDEKIVISVSYKI